MHENETKRRVAMSAHERGDLFYVTRLNANRVNALNSLRYSAFSASPRLLALLGGLLFSATSLLANQVTFQVNLAVQRTLGNFNSLNGDTVLVAGTFSSPDWTTTSVLAPSAGDTNIYVGTFNNDVSTSTGNYKFIINPGGNSPANQLIWESGNNRSFAVAATDQTLPVVYFNNVTSSTITVTTQITFRVNVAAQIAAGDFDPATDTVSVASDALSNWTATAAPLTNSPLQPYLWRGTFNVTHTTGTPLNYKFILHPQLGGEVWESDGVGSNGAQNRQLDFTGAGVLLPLVSFNNEAEEQEFLAGADMSHLMFFEDRGVTYRVNGEVRDALELLRERGLNCIRLRLFTSSAAQAQANAYNYTNNLDYTLPLAVRVKNAGLKLLLDFHYSDSWADPGKQTKPAAWTNLNFTELKAELRAYNSNVIAALSAAGALPDYVQVGNEITPGMLWNDGRVGGSYDNATQWSQLAQLLTSAVQGIHDAASNQMPKLIVHIDRGGDWGATRWYFDNIESRQVPFDYIGQSYYAWWHGSPESLQTCLSNAAVRYGRPIIVAETAFPWSNSTNIYGFPASTNGQVEYTVALAQIVKNVPDNNGIGIFWWGTEYQQVSGQGLAGFDRRSFFAVGGNVLPVAGVLGQLTAPVKMSAGLQGNNLKLQWPLSGAGMILRTSTNLTLPESWQDVTNEIETAGSTFNATVPIGPAPANYYRLETN